ncbi:glycosyltransferase [Caulobacter sp. S45]|uniref:glycosyltransferase n=1 Tax=Caulobacter sp. S45 TaxID=1641861 RepID=UPI00131C6E78|nr:glycosyltransferase [Caulobacter sp. S45]
MRIGIMVPDLSTGDAVSNDASGMYKALELAGFEVHMFTISGHSSTAISALPYDQITWRLNSQDDLLIYHFCTADPYAVAILRQLNCGVALKYHNVTPSRFMARYSAGLTWATKHGRSMISEFAEIGFELFISDSLYNQSELTARGVSSRLCHVVAPFHQVDNLLLEEEEPGTVEYLMHSSMNILTVGRVVPNKGHINMIEGFARYMEASGVRAHFHVVGSHDGRLRVYSDELHRIALDLNVADCISYHPLVPPNALASYYRHCDVYLTASHHEGFCVPAIEAMAFNLPIISNAAAALPETCGDAAVYAVSAVEIGAALEALLGDDDSRENLARRGAKRYAQNYAGRLIKQRFLTLIDRWLEARRSPFFQAVIPEGVDWFDLPEFDAILKETIDIHPVNFDWTLQGADRRADLIDWILHTGRRSSAVLDRYVRSEGFKEYAESVELPKHAADIPTMAKMIWKFNRFIRAQYPLNDLEGVGDFLRWFWSEAIVLYELEGLLQESERRMLGSFRNESLI